MYREDKVVGLETCTEKKMALNSEVVVHRKITSLPPGEWQQDGQLSCLMIFQLTANLQ